MFTTILSAVRKLRHTGSTNARWQSKGSRLSLESLEDRVVLSGIPAAPVFTATPASSSQINLAWYSVYGATSYQIEEYSNGAWRQLGSQSSSSTSCSITGLAANTTYEFDVVASNIYGSDWGTPRLATTLQAPPAAPAFTTKATSSTQVALAWNTVPGAASYLIEGYFNGAWSQLGSFNGSSTSCTVYGLTPNTTVELDVVAASAAGATWGTAQYVTTLPAAPAAPVFTAAATSPSQVVLAWNAVPGAANYLIEKMVNGSWQQLGSLNGSSTGVTVTGLSANTTYEFDVVAVNSAGSTWATPQYAATEESSVTTNGAWSGYTIAPSQGMGQVNAVGGTWVQPAVSSTGAYSDVAFWVGIDGAHNSTVEQLGTSWSASGGYQAWVEFFGDRVQTSPTTWVPGPYFSPYYIPTLVIQPGDTVSADVVFVSNTSTTSTFRFQFQVVAPNGQTQSWQQTLTTSYVVAARASGEWIVESPSGGNAPLANFGKMGFTGGWAAVGTTTGPITAFPNSEINLLPQNNSGGGTDYTSGVVNSNSPGPWEPSGAASSSFTVVFASANSSAANFSNSQSPVGGAAHGLPITNGSANALFGAIPLASTAATPQTASTPTVDSSANDAIWMELDNAEMTYLLRRSLFATQSS